MEHSANIIKFFDPKAPFYEFSNYYKSPIILDEKKYETVEHYYQSQKFNWYGASNSDMEYSNLINSTNTPNKAKVLATQKIRTLNSYERKWTVSPRDSRLLNNIIKEYKTLGVKPRPDWDCVKDDIMRRALWAKFNSSARLKQLLLDTKDKELAEDNPYDKYWGILGENKLGILLMEIRDTILYYQNV